MKYIYIFTVIAVVTASGCNNPRTAEINKLKDECIKVHDEVMPRLDELSGYRASLREWKKDLDTITTDTLAALRQSVLSQVLQLDSADDAMMDWMAGYEPKYESTHSIDSAVVYYTKQKEEINEVKNLMEESISNAKELLAQRH